MTCGVLLILYGVLFVIHFFIPGLSYEMIFRFWPVILIALGVEMILSERKKAEDVLLKYDVGAIILTIVLAFFAMGMGVVEFCMEHYQEAGIGLYF